MAIFAPAALELELGPRVGVVVRVVEPDTPEVNGGEEADDAPLNAGTVAVGLGVADALFGLSTLWAFVRKEE